MKLLQMKGPTVALLSELVKAVAKVEGIDEVSVATYARAAREAGHISQKGRGRGAAHMTFQDGANLLIAVNAAGLAREVPKAISDFGGLGIVKSKFNFSERPRGPRALIRNLLGDQESFGCKLARLIEFSCPQRGTTGLREILERTIPKADAEYAKKYGIEMYANLEVEFARPNNEVTIRVNSPHLDFKYKAETPVYTSKIAEVLYGIEVEEGDELYVPDRWDAVSITDRTLAEVARVIAS